MKSGANPEIQKGPAGTLARNRDTFYFTENSCGGCVVLALGLDPKFTNAKKYNKKASQSYIKRGSLTE